MVQHMTLLQTNRQTGCSGAMVTGPVPLPWPAAMMPSTQPLRAELPLVPRCRQRPRRQPFRPARPVPNNQPSTSMVHRLPVANQIWLRAMASYRQCPILLVDPDPGPGFGARASAFAVSTPRGPPGDRIMLDQRGCTRRCCLASSVVQATQLAIYRVIEDPDDASVKV